MIYLDNSATTKIRDEALAVYNEIATATFGNPSSLHEAGFAAEQVIKDARKTILATVGAKDAGLVFTASGSEANNLAIFGRAFSKERYKNGMKILTTDGEHASVDAPLAKLASLGFKIVKIPTKGGKLDTGAVLSELTKDVILATVMLVNNETGAFYDVAGFSKILKAKCPDALLHVDATQGYMKVPCSLSALGADMITLSSHKIEGPKGVGALVVSPNVKKTRGLSPLIFGGGQEDGLRSGTENVPGIAAFAKAAALAKEEFAASTAAMEHLREVLIARITMDPALEGITLTLPERHAPHILNITLPGIKSETMLHFLSAAGICVSSGSACSSNGAHVSSALVAFGRSAEEADCSLRVSFSHRNTEEDVDTLCDTLGEGLAKLARIRR